ncbi:MAG TPA: hypothetical protein ENK67_07675 [Flavobacteriia bacterium]|nr:hypothetical protein [Flavobacteriia bacterium]
MTDLIILSVPDSDLNEYFKKCRSHLELFVSKQSLAITIHGEHGVFTQKTLEEKIQCFTDGYALIIYAHGTENSVTNKDGEEILHESQAHILSNALVYSTACYNASSLGFKLSNYGCKLFFGYSDKAYVAHTDNYIEKAFIETDNFALIKILLGENDCTKLAEETEEFFKTKYNDIKENYYESAALLMHNKEAVRFYQNHAEC